MIEMKPSTRLQCQEVWTQQWIRKNVKRDHPCFSHSLPVSPWEPLMLFFSLFTKSSFGLTCQHQLFPSVSEHTLLVCFLFFSFLPFSFLFFFLLSGKHLFSREFSFTLVQHCHHWHIASQAAVSRAPRESSVLRVLFVQQPAEHLTLYHLVCPPTIIVKKTVIRPLDM